MKRCACPSLRADDCIAARYPKPFGFDDEDPPEDERCCCACHSEEEEESDWDEEAG